MAEIVPDDAAEAVPERLRALYSAHATAVVTRLRRLTGDPELARDLAQDAFVVAMRRLHEVPDDPPPAAWIHRIAFNLLRDHRRSRRRRTRLLSMLRRKTTGHPALVGQGPTPTPSLAANLDAALTELDQDKRDAFVLRIVEGLSLDEAAQILGTTVQTVSYRTKKAEEIVRRHFEGDPS
ncbi:MAG: sigma-70 family RNA polymerase sigma factor [Myxococcota bacterium]